MDTLIEVSGGKNAYGVYANTSARSTSYGNGTSEISMEELSGRITVTAGTGSAYGIYSSGAINGGHRTIVTKEAVYDEEGTLVSAEETEDQTLAMIVSGTVSVSGGSYASGIYGSDLYLSIQKDSMIDVFAATDGNVTAIYGNTTTIENFDADLSINTVGTGIATGISSYRLGMKSLAGSISINAKGTGTAKALSFSAGTLDGLPGSLTVESGGDGIVVGNSKDVTIRNCVCDRNHRQGLST